MCTRPNKIQMTFTQKWKCPLRHEGSIADHYTASRGAKRKKVEPSTAEESKPND